LDILSRSCGGYGWLLPGGGSRSGTHFWTFCPEVGGWGTGGCSQARPAGQELTSGHFVQKLRSGGPVAAARPGRPARSRLLDILSRSSAAGYRWLLRGKGSWPGTNFWTFCPEVEEVASGCLLSCRGSRSGTHFWTFCPEVLGWGTGGCYPAWATGQGPT